jgi:hypothetical protein
VALSGAALAAALAGGAATAAVPAQLVLSTAKVAALVAAGNAAAVGSQAAVLMHEFQRGMLMAKLKVGAALAAMAVVLGVGGLAFQAAGQAPAPRPAKSAEVRPEGGAAARSLTEVELLRKEVDILKLQVEVLQDKVRALRGEGGGRAKEAPAGLLLRDGQDARKDWSADKDAKGRPPADKAGPNWGPAGQRFERRPADKAPLFRRDETLAKPPADYAPRLEGARERLGKPADAVRQAEAALKALREASDPEARRRAAEALEKAARQLRGPAGNKAPRE